MHLTLKPSQLGNMGFFVDGLFSLTEPFAREAEQGTGNLTENEYSLFVQDWEDVCKLSDKVGAGDWSTLRSKSRRER
jgi:hypothetical protein